MKGKINTFKRIFFSINKELKTLFVMPLTERYKRVKPDNPCRICAVETEYSSLKKITCVMNTNESPSPKTLVKLLSKEERKSRRNSILFLEIKSQKLILFNIISMKSKKLIM